MPDVYAAARGRRAWRRSVAATRPGAPPRRFFAATGLRPGMRVVDIGCGALGPAGAGAGPRHHRRRPRPAPALPRAVRAGRRRRAACPSPTARSTSPTPRRVIEHVAARAPGRVRRRGAPRRARLVRPDARRGRSRSSPTRCCPSPTGCRPRPRRPYWRLGAAGAWEDIALLRPARARGAVRPRRTREARPAHEELGGACGRSALVRAPADRPEHDAERRAGARRAA